MVTYDTVIKEVCKREIENDLYEIKINDIDIYNYLKRYIRNKYLSLNGLEENAQLPVQSRVTQIKSIAISLYQILKILLCRKHYDNCVHSFRRVEKIFGFYVDKFTDPIIDNSSISENCIIVEVGKNGKHLTPRRHENRIIYADFFNFFALIASMCISLIYEIRHKSTFNRLFKTLDKAFPDILYSRREIVRTVCYGLFKGLVYSKFYKRIHCKRLIAPSRADFHAMIPAARINKMRVIELQHGITYSESLTYSGHQSLMFTPDIFLTFGEMNPKNVYGIEEDKIHNVGFAFLDYIENNLALEKNRDSGVLFISEPSVTKPMISIALKFAKKHPHITFSFRPHPMEQLTQEQLSLLSSTKNVVLDDNTQNILVSLAKYRYVVGENSTALYEALSFGCLVGKLAMNGLSPRYLEESDKNFFFEINNEDDFIKFLEYNIEANSVKHIYSPYSRDAFEKLIM